MTLPQPAPAVPVAARSVDEHVAAVLDGVAPLAPADVALADAAGLVLAGPVVSGLDLPAFDNSAMDGYAVRLADVAGASPQAPALLVVADDVAAGALPRAALVPGRAARIMTGAPVPEGTEAVVPVEWTDAGTAAVRVEREPAPGANVRSRGEDVAAGAAVLPAGAVVTPQVVGLLAGIGHARVRVHRRPRVLVLSTGAELVPPGTERTGAQIHDANGPMLAAAVRALGGEPVTAPVVADRPGALLAALEPHLDDVDLVVTSAGVSEGAYDVVKSDLAAAADVTFARVAMQPGRPQGHGRLGPRRVPVLTLPGNPASAFVSFQVFVRPVLRRLLGHADTAAALVPATLTQAVRSPAGRRQFLRARWRRDASGALVTPVGGPGSHLLGGLAASDVLVVVPEDVTEVAAGERVEVMLTEGAVQ